MRVANDDVATAYVCFRPIADTSPRFASDPDLWSSTNRVLERSNREEVKREA